MPVRTDAGQPVTRVWKEGDDRQAAVFFPQATDNMTPASTLESAHFVIYADFVDDEYLRRLSLDMEKYFSTLQKEFWDFLRPENREARLEVAVFSDAAAFDRFAAADAGIAPGERGYSNKRANRIAILRQKEYARDVMTAVHELAHAFNRFSTPHSPTWADEGLAQYYASYAAERAGAAGIYDGVNLGALAAIDAGIKAGRFAPLGQLLTMDEAAFYADKTDTFYAEAWALVYYLRRGTPEGDARFGDYYESLTRGGDEYGAFTRSYGANVDVMESIWIRYLDRLYRQTRLQEEKLKTSEPTPGTTR